VLLRILPQRCHFVFTASSSCALTNIFQSLPSSPGLGPCSEPLQSPAGSRLAQSVSGLCRASCTVADPRVNLATNSIFSVALTEASAFILLGFAIASQTAEVLVAFPAAFLGRGGGLQTLLAWDPGRCSLSPHLAGLSLPQAPLACPYNRPLPGGDRGSVGVADFCARALPRHAQVTQTAWENTSFCITRGLFGAFL